MVKGACWWVVIATCGHWMLAGDHSWAVGGQCGCHLCHSIGAGCLLWAVVAGCGRCWLGGSFMGGDGIFHGQSASSWSNNVACLLTCHVIGHVLTWLVTWLATCRCYGGWWL